MNYLSMQASRHVRVVYAKLPIANILKTWETLYSVCLAHSLLEFIFSNKLKVGPNIINWGKLFEINKVT